MIQFFAPDIVKTLTLPESDSGHCIRVLRMKEGDNIEVIDGTGLRYICRIVSAHQKHTAVEIIETIESPLSWKQKIIVAVAPTKHIDRMEWMVEKLTEIGVNRIIPILCSHSERKEIKIERLEKIAIAAMKQSLKSVLPEISPMTPVMNVINGFADSDRFIAYCDRSIPRKSLVKEYRPNTSSIIMIGPEGDFAPNEIKTALDAGWTPVSLGDNRLRTETAAITACDTFHIIDQLNR